MELEIILEKLDRIEQYLIQSKEVLTAKELAEYTGFKISYIYKLVHLKHIPFSKPHGKNLFFDRMKINRWLLNNETRSIINVENDLEEFLESNKKSI